MKNLLEKDNNILSKLWRNDISKKVISGILILTFAGLCNFYITTKIANATTDFKLEVVALQVRINKLESTTYNQDLVIARLEGELEAYKARCARIENKLK